uniref:Uncharacterized protein n=1 Tax=Hordeum vulgare subsp. vulgare TaxID=112509 RepID=A0A8I6WS19_HORVV
MHALFASGNMCAVRLHSHFTSRNCLSVFTKENKGKCAVRLHWHFTSRNCLSVLTKENKGKWKKIIKLVRWWFRLSPNSRGKKHGKFPRNLVLHSLINGMMLAYFLCFLQIASHCNMV